MLKILIFIVIAVLVLLGASYLKPSAQDESNMQEQVSETANQNNMNIEDIKVGTGAEAAVGKKITVHYVGTLDDGTTFDSSKVRGEPATFELKPGGLIEGWIKGIPGMKVGGVRKLTIPSELGYGAAGFPPVIPPNATLHFEVELLDVK